jgi:DNA-binding NtrC family response regulator
MAAILIIEDEHALGGALSLAITRLGHTPTLAASGAAALEKISKQSFEAIVLDIGLPDISGLEVLKKIRHAGSKIPVVIITAHATLDHAITSQKLGIADYLVKPLDLQRFEEVISSLVSKSIPIAEATQPAATSLIGAAPGMHRVFLGIARACSGEMPVLIHGPSGSGKTLAARVIHTNSTRNAHPLRRIECATIQQTAALQNHLADTSGTLVLEGIDSLSPALQATLAEAITQKHETLPRLIATINGDPHQADQTSSLRPDIFYAFSPLSIAIPPLRERTGDIPALSRFFHGLQENPSPFEITSPALCALQAYSWPGNIRELQHVLEHAWAISRGGGILPGHLPPHVAEALHTSGGKIVSGELKATLARWIDSQMEILPEDSWQYDTFLEEIEATLLRHLLERFEHRPTRLAAALRMNRATLRQKLKRCGLSGNPELRPPHSPVS